MTKDMSENITCVICGHMVNICRPAHKLHKVYQPICVSNPPVDANLIFWKHK